MPAPWGLLPAVIPVYSVIFPQLLPDIGRMIIIPERGKIIPQGRRRLLPGTDRGEILPGLLILKLNRIKPSAGLFENGKRKALGNILLPPSGPATYGFEVNVCFSIHYLYLV
jgi:hypothetical protein